MKRQPDDFPAYVHRQTHGDYKRDEKCEEPRLEGWETSSTVALILTLILFVVLAYIYALIKPQWCDEVWQMIPAANLAFNGYLGMGDQTTLILPTLNSETHMYWYPPLSHVSLAIWFKVWDGYNLMLARWHTIAWGVVLLCGISIRWIPLTLWKPPVPGLHKSLIEARWIGVWAALICALDYNFLYSSDARPDLMCAALGIWAIATRSAWFAAAACMVHPFGIMYPIALACIKRKVEWLPYLVVAGAWGIYIMQDPTLWWETIVNQYIVHVVQIAYTPGLAVYIGFGEGWRLVLLATYVLCAAVVALKHRDIALCLGLIVLPAFFLTRAAYYFPHAVPWLALCVAIQMRKYPWLCVIVLLECVFAVTTLIPLWSWDGVFNLR